jgi:hypothetical protein
MRSWGLALRSSLFILGNLFYKIRDASSKLSRHFQERSNELKSVRRACEIGYIFHRSAFFLWLTAAWAAFKKNKLDLL